MQTYDEQAAFYNAHWPAMKAAAEAGGGKAVSEFILGFEDELERRVLFMFARQGLAMDDWQGKSFDALIEVADAGIAELIRQSEGTKDPETRDKRIDAANVISFNLGADLADCWPGDDQPREVRHFLRGAQAGEECLRWREQLKKPAGPLSMAWWLKGIHEFCLGKKQAAIDSFQQSLDLARKDAANAGLATDISAAGTFPVILGTGYLGLAQWRAGDDDGQAQYLQAIAAFSEQAQDDKTKDDALFGIAQLEAVRSKYVEQ
ncbi:hypothetical protein JW859_12380 [bacterium]|nr:hypothetical protein [bacterium]